MGISCFGVVARWKVRGDPSWKVQSLVVAPYTTKHDEFQFGPSDFVFKFESSIGLANEAPPLVRRVRIAKKGLTHWKVVSHHAI